MSTWRITVDLIEVPFAAACVVVAAGFEPKRVLIDGDRVAFLFGDEAAAAAERFHQVKAHLRALEGKARRTMVGAGR